VVDEEPSPVSKAVAVRTFLVAHPEAKNAEVVAALAADGVTISPNYVSIVRGAKKSGSKKRGIKKRGVKQSVSSLKDVLRQERAALQKRIEAIDTLMG
jgi:hypothetical protein